MFPKATIKILHDTSCTSRTQPPTFLFAYSNDLDSQTVLDTWAGFLSVEAEVSVQFSWFANVRFDTQQLDEIEFHKNYNDVQQSIHQHLPDPSQGFGNSSIGSNVFQVIEVGQLADLSGVSNQSYIQKFFSNTQAPVCGSIVFILVKRYPNEADVSGMIAKIRSHHTIVHVMTSSTPSGGTQAQAVYNVASKTNGLGAFESDNEFSDMIGRFPMFATPYPVYAAIVKASGSNSVNLPQFSPPQSDDYWVALTYQDHLPIDAFKSVSLNWISVDSSDSSSFSVSTENIPGDDGGTYAAEWFPFQLKTYNMTFSYEFSDSNVESLQVRIYSGKPLDHWLPYSD